MNTGEKTRTRCQQCGSHGAPGEYHPYAYCILHKALGEDAARANINAVLDHGRKLERQKLPNDATLDRVK